MAAKIKISPAAMQDIQHASDYYNQQQKGLGKRFVRTVHDTFSKIRTMPQSASFAFDTVRYKVIDSFPFIITYEADENTIQILRVFNTYLNPEKL